jgi:F-type H+-transporting ATPase subunit epsilon
MKTFNLSITTPEKTHYDGRVASAIAPSSIGYMGILADHAPLVATLAAGNIAVKESDGKQRVFRIDGGFLEIKKNVVTILI